MISTRGETLFLGTDPRSRLVGAGPGKSRIVPNGEGTSQDFTLLDTFDGQVVAAGRLLIATEDRWILLGGRDGVLRQDRAEPDFVAQLPEGPVTRALAGMVSPLRILMPIAAGVLTRQDLAMLDDVEKTLVRCDTWSFTTTDGGCAAMVELRPLRGYDRALARLRAHLERLTGGGLKDARAMAVALRPTEAHYDGKPSIPIRAEEEAFRAANEIIRVHLAIAQRNEAGAVADLDSEFLHDYRVALRKVRSVISLFKGVYDAEQTAELKARFGALMAHTGRLRDLDVYLIERPRYLSLVPEAMRPGLERLFEIFAEERVAEQARLATHFRSEAYAREMSRLVKLFDSPKRLSKGPEAGRPALDLARTLIWARYRKVCKIAAGIDDATPDERVHELRIHCKKLRYLMEFFAPLFGKAEVKPLVGALKRLQDNLGAFNDYSVQQESLAGVLDGLHEKWDAFRVEIAQSLGALVTVLHQRQLEERARVVASFAAFDGPDIRAGFRQLFKAEGDAK